MRSLTTQKLENIQAMQAPNCNVAIDVQSRDLVEHILQAIIEWR